MCITIKTTNKEKIKKFRLRNPQLLVSVLANKQEICLGVRVLLP